MISIHRSLDKRDLVVFFFSFSVVTFAVLRGYTVHFLGLGRTRIPRSRPSLLDLERSLLPILHAFRPFGVDTSAVLIRPHARLRLRTRGAGVS